MKREFITSDIGIGYTKAVLPSGLEIYILEKKEYSSAYALFGTRYGSIDTKFSRDGINFTEVPEGIAHFLEHKLFESEDGDAFTKYAKTGAYANAYTSFDRTCYIFSCSENFGENLDILLDFVQSPYFTAKTVQKEQGIIGQEIRMYEDSPAWRVMFNMLSSMYQNHPVRIDIAGTVESIAKIDDKLLYECYNTFYHPSNMFICIAGNVDTEHILSVVQKSIKRSDTATIIRGKFKENAGVSKEYTEQNLQVAQPLFCYGYKLNFNRPQMTVFEKVGMQLALELISGDTSLLYEQLINDGLVNDEFDTEVFSGHGYASVIFSGESNNPQRVKQCINDEIARIIENGIDSDVFEAIKCGMYGEAIKRFDNNEAVVSLLVDSAMFGNSAFEELEVLSKIKAEDVLNFVKMLKRQASVLSVVKNKE